MRFFLGMISTFDLALHCYLTTHQLVWHEDTALATELGCCIPLQLVPILVSGGGVLCMDTSAFSDTDTDEQACLVAYNVG